MTAEDRRQALHAAMSLFVVALPWLTRGQAVAVAAAAVVLNWVVLPRTKLDRALRREGAPWLDGLKTYPVAVLLALVLFPGPAAAAAWAVLGIGDAASNVIGRRAGRPPFLGRTDRSLAGTVAFVATGAPAALAAYAWVADAPVTPRVVVAALAAALAGAAAELLVPRRLDDNVPVTLAAGAAFALVAA